MLLFCNLFSGSTGNATYIGNERDAVLVDCGMSFKQITTALSEARLDAGLIRAILITHEHSDHIRGADVTARRLGVPLIATAACQDAMDRHLGRLSPALRVGIEPGESLYLGSLEAASFPLPHDAAGPVGYRIFSREGSAACATDMGCFTREAENALWGCDVLLLESNHDPELLRQNPHYSESLKRRVLSKRGHLSNEQCAEAARRLLPGGTRHFLLGHLSRENNRPELAESVTRAALEEALGGEEYTLEVASPVGPVRVYALGT